MSNPCLEECLADEPNTWERKPKRRNSKHPDPVLQNRTRSSPTITLTRQFSDGPLTYAQAAGSSSNPALQRNSITTVPEWAVQRTSPTPAPVSSRKYSMMPSPSLKKSDSVDNQSDITASVFDDDEDHVNSDFETDISTASLDDLPTELNRDERLIRPERYYRDLEELEANVAGNSGLFLLKRENRQAYPHGRYKLKFNYHGHGGTTTNQPINYDDSVMSFCNENTGPQQGLGSAHTTSSSSTAPAGKYLSSGLHFHKIHVGIIRTSCFYPFIRNMLILIDLAFWAFHVLECRNLMLQIKSNLAMMVAARYCNSSINILSVDRLRPSVARLTNFDIDAITHLCAMFEVCLQMIVATIERDSRTHADIVMKIDDITRHSEDILDKLCLPKGHTLSQSGKVGMWRKAVLILDIGIISYCGAHLERFDESHLNEDLNFAKITPAWTYVVDGTEGIMLRRRSLSCLGEFLGSHRVWMFQSNLSWEDDQPLYLSTTIEEFADIWGPVWAAKETEDSNTVIKYSTGSGSIFPWPRGDSNPQTNDNEILCHWVRFGDDEKKSKSALQPGARLLIGASTELEKR